MFDPNLLQQTLQTLGMKVWVYHPDSGKYEDEGIFAELGHSQNPSSQAEMLELVHPEDRLTVINGFGDLLSEETERICLEVRLKAPDEQFFWRAIHGAVVREENQARKILGFAMDIHQKRTQAEKLHQLATKDNLTGVFNKTMGMVLLDKLRIQSGKSNQYLRLLIIEIKNLKSLNEMHGIDAGNLLIQALCGILQQQMQKDHLLCRLEGATLLLAQAGATALDAEIWMDQIENRIQEFNVRKNLNFALSIRWGVCDSDRPAGERSEILVARARQNLLQRSQGRA